MLGQELTKVFSDTELQAWDREECDVLAPDCEEKIKAFAPDLILNAIAYNDVDAAEGDGREMAFKLNAEVPGNLARIARDLGSTIVHYSSDYVFDGERGGYSEENAVDPVNTYGQSKRAGEVAVLESGTRAYVLRLAWLFGRPAVSERGKRAFVDVMLDLAKTKDHLDLVNDEASSPTYAPDLANLTRRIVETMEPGLYHAANSGSCTWYELALEAFRLRGVNIDTAPVSGKMFPRAAKRPKNGSLVSVKLPKQRTWQEALAEYLTVGSW